jgi:hypothetical protein
VILETLNSLQAKLKFLHSFRRESRSKNTSEQSEEALTSSSLLNEASIDESQTLQSSVTPGVTRGTRRSIGKKSNVIILLKFFKLFRVNSLKKFFEL